MENIITNQPLHQNRAKITQEIGTFWDKTSVAWATIWGPHIHHGYFENQGETPIQAQEKLIEKLLELLKISFGAKILDVGCGMGGSSFYLAKKFGAQVTGITLSPKQVEMATKLAAEKQIKTVRFQVEDALSLASFPDSSVDIVWSLESCEQFYDKPLFIRQAHRVLRPGGRLMLATWCSGAEEYFGPEAKQYRKLCAALQLPYMPTIDRYGKILRNQGFIVEQKLNWSAKVKDTWAIGLASLRAHSIFKILKISGWRGLIFGRQGKLMQEAFEKQHVTYGVFIAHKSNGLKKRAKDG